MALSAPLRHEQQLLFEAMLGLTRQAAGPLTAGELLELLAERARLMEQVAAIDARCGVAATAGGTATDPDRLRCLQALIELSTDLLALATAQRDALLRRLLAVPPPRRH